MKPLWIFRNFPKKYFYRLQFMIILYSVYKKKSKHAAYMKNYAI